MRLVQGLTCSKGGRAVQGVRLLQFEKRNEVVSRSCEDLTLRQARMRTYSSRTNRVSSTSTCIPENMEQHRRAPSKLEWSGKIVWPIRAVHSSHRHSTSYQANKRKENAPSTSLTPEFRRLGQTVRSLYYTRVSPLPLQPCSDKLTIGDHALYSPGCT